MKHFFFTIACSLAALCAQTQEIIDTVQVRVQYRATYKLRKKVHSPIPMPCTTTFSFAMRKSFLPLRGNWPKAIPLSSVIRAIKPYVNDHSASFNFFSDLSVSYQLKDSEISLSLNNLMGNDTYERRIIRSEFITHTVHRLRPREFILKYSFAL